MKKIILTLLAFTSFSLVKSQSVAADWTRTDCSGTSHTLFTYLDAEEVVVMEFSMGCSSCTIVGASLMDIKSKYEISHPGKVKWFYMDYWASNNCVTEVDPVTSMYAFDAGFEHCLIQKNYYYSSSPMPAIVIVGGSNHLVLSSKVNYSPSDTTNIIATIDNFFATVGMNEIKNANSLATIYPNPSTGKINVSIDWKLNQNANLIVFDMLGNQVYACDYDLTIGKQEISLTLDNLNKGNYFLKIQSPEQTISLPFNLK